MLFTNTGAICIHLGYSKRLAAVLPVTVTTIKCFTNADKINDHI